MCMYILVTSVCRLLDTCPSVHGACIFAFVMCHLFSFVCMCMLISGASVALDWLSWYSRFYRDILYGWVCLLVYECACMHECIG